MPLYEYECKSCHHRFEKIEHVSTSSTRKCPKCSEKAERVLTAAAFQFKGSGWYVTDYAGKNADAPVGAEKDDGKPAKESPAKKEPAAAKESSKKSKKD